MRFATAVPNEVCSKIILVYSNLQLIIVDLSVLPVMIILYLPKLIAKVREHSVYLGVK